MKLNKYFLIGAMGLGLFACSDDLNDENGQNGNKSDGKMANVSIKFDFNGTRSRAVGDLPTGNYDDNGTQAESTVNKLRIIVTDEDGKVEYNQLYQGTEGDNKLPDGINGMSEPYEGSGTIEFKIPTGAKVFYAYVNEEDKSSETGTAANASDLKVAVGQSFTNAIKAQDATYFSTGSNFHMSGLVKQTVTEVAEESTNDVTINVDRTVARVDLKLASTYNNDEATNKVKLTKLTAGIGNADLKFKQTDSSDDKLWGTYRFTYDDTDGAKRITPYYSEIPTTDNYANVYIRSNNKTENEQDDLLTKSGAPEAYPTHTYYCLENTHATYKKGNTTFVQITATMIPNATVKFSYTAATDNVGEKVEIVEGSTITTAGTPETFYLITKVNDPTGTEKDRLNTYIWEKDLIDLFNSNGFVSDEDKEDIEDINNNPGKIKAVRNALNRHHYEFTEAYSGGVGYFYKAVNDMKDANGKYINKAPVFRNHWYDLTINSIKLPGSPAPDFGGNEDLHPDTDVEMTVKIRQWNKVGHTVNLE